MIRRTLFSLLLLAALAGLIWFGWRNVSWFRSAISEPEPLPPPTSYETKAAVGSLAPNFELKTLDGREVRLGDYLGRVVIVEYWASWCPFCQTELPNLARLAASAPRDVVVLAINRGELPDVAKAYADKYVKRPANMLFLLDPEDKTYRAYEGTTMPQSFYIDRDGVVRTVAIQELLLGEMRDAARPLILAPAACPNGKYGQQCR